jgi:methylenetetrahydrofolate dehydrogenase (NADP+)/methenyltetrahydrofolate cyclohydrolase
MLKPGAVVVDVGINVVDGRIVGDVEFASAERVASAITPVPGGVGPLTSALLLSHLMRAAQRQKAVEPHRHLGGEQDRPTPAAAARQDSRR